MSQQIKALFEKVGPRYSVRINVKLTTEVRKTLPQKLALDPEKLGARKIARIDRTDGLKMALDDGA